MTSPESRHPANPRIAFLTNSIEYSFYTDVLSGILEKTERSGARLTILVGGSLSKDCTQSAEDNLIYKFANNNSFDGVIILGDLGREISSTEFTHFCNTFHDLPHTCIAFPGENDPGVRIDYETGIHDLVDHLVRHHGYQRIAYISGPSHNYDSQQKLANFQKALSSHGIKSEPDLIAEGDFGYESGKKAVTRLLEMHGTNLDAIFVASDGMAVAAFDKLAQLGYSVPEDIALACFNDSRDLQHHIPPMTTINQNLRDQGRNAVEDLLGKMRGEIPTAGYSVPTSLVIRRSCGCPYEASSVPARLLPDVGNGSMEDFFSRASEILTGSQPILDNAYLSRDFRPQLAELLISLAASHSDREQASAFSRLLGTIIKQPGITEADLEFLQHYLLQFLQQYHRLVNAQSGYMHTIPALVHKGIHLLTGSLYRLRSSSEQTVKSLFLEIKYFSQAINAATDIGNLCTQVLRHLPEFGIRKAALTLYSTGIHYRDDGESLPDYSKLVLAFDEQGEIVFGPSESLIRNSEMKAHSLFRDNPPVPLVMLPLYFRKEHYGCIIMQYDAGIRAMLYATLSGLISGAISTIFSLNNLRSMEQQIMHSSQMAELGELTSGMSHELRNPLNAIINLAMLDQDSLEDLHDLFRKLRGESDAEAHNKSEKIFSTLLESNRSIQKQSSQAVAIISGILKQARGDSSGVELCDLNKLIEESLLLAFHSCRSRYPDFEYRVEKDLYGELPPYRGNVSQLSRAILNIISNALDAMRYRNNDEDNYKALLSVHSDFRRDRIQITITDNGPGIPEAIRDRIFDAFFSTKPTNEGTGLGLKMSYDIIVKGHGGDIFCESKPGEYTSFTILL